ncbi:BCCT family transporter [Staphylococcus aureus]
MIFNTGGVIEWAFYYQVPPIGAKSMSDEALQYATQYGMFHWGQLLGLFSLYQHYQLVI